MTNNPPPPTGYDSWIAVYDKMISIGECENESSLATMIKDYAFRELLQARLTNREYLLVHDAFSVAKLGSFNTEEQEIIRKLQTAAR